MHVLIYGLSKYFQGSLGRQYVKMFNLKIVNAIIFNTSGPGKKNDIFLNIEDASLFKPDVTVVCSPASTHMLYAQIFADNKSSIFIEKPISTSPNGIKNLIKTCEQNRTVLQVGYNLRFSLSLQSYRALLHREHNV